VAVTPEGRLAAYAMGHFSSEENRLRGQKIGYVDPVATQPDFQGKGLARALLLAGFARLEECGMEFAGVSTSGENTAMIRTAESAGCHRYSTTIFFKRSLYRGERGEWIEAVQEGGGIRSSSSCAVHPLGAAGIGLL
jgi:mycothiol synthase